LHVAQRFERFLDTHRRLDGGRWTGQRLDSAICANLDHPVILAKGTWSVKPKTNFVFSVSIDATGVDSTSNCSSLLKATVGSVA
jgi:hypothetical protein